MSYTVSDVAPTNPDERLRSLGLDLPAVPPIPLGVQPNRSTMLVHNGLGFVSGVGPIGTTGVLGADMDVEEGAKAAHRAALFMLRRIVDELGELSRIDRWIKVIGFIRCTPEFAEQPSVLNGFSDLIIDVFGDPGRCARSAIGTNALPLNMPIEIEAIVAVS